MAKMKNSGEINTKAEKKEYEGKKYRCDKCYKELTIESNYYKLKENNLCKYSILPVCKKCLRKEFERLRFEHGDRTALRILFRKIDKPYIDDIVNKALLRDNEDLIGYCLKCINGFKQFKGMTYDDSDFIRNKKIEIDSDGEIKSQISNFTDEEWERWSGYGLEPEEMLASNLFYNKLVTTYGFTTLAEKSGAQNLTVAQINLKKAYKEADALAIDKMSRIVSGIESSLNIQAKQRKEDEGQACWGEWVRQIENTEPIGEPRKEFKDVDGILKLVARYVVGYLTVAFGKARAEEVLGEDSDILKKED